MGQILAKIVLWLVAGGAVGFLTSFLIMSVKKDTTDVMHIFYNGYLQYSFGYQAGFFAVLGAVAFIYYRKAEPQSVREPMKKRIRPTITRMFQYQPMKLTW